MSIVRKLDRRSLVGLFVLLSIGVMFLSLPSSASGASTGASFDHIIIVAMENQNYCSGVVVCGDTATGFIPQLGAAGTILSNYQAYSQSIGGCSHGCYEAFTAGNQLLSDGGCPRASSPCSGAPQPDITKQLQAAGLTAALFCEDGCPRGSDHFPWIEYTDDWQSCMAASSFNCAGTAGPDGALTFNSVSSTGNVAFINYLNSASPANYIWFTPTDSHNMHDNSVTSGDAYIQSLLVGNGTLANPSANSVFASSLWKAGHTLFYLWWDENSNPPQVLYGPMVKSGYVASETINEYYMLHTIEANWGLPAITSVVSGDTPITDIFQSLGPLPLSSSFTHLPTAPVAETLVSFTGIATGGTGPYSYSWIFGDGGTATGSAPSHTYSVAGNYTVSLTVIDSASGTAKYNQTINVSPIPALAARFTYTPSQPVPGQSVSFTATATGGISPYTYSWNFGDGGTSTSQNPSNTYSNSGSYTVTLNVTDFLGTHALSTQTITVSPPGALMASFTITPTIPVSGETATFTATASGGTSPYTYSWNLAGTSRTGNPVSQSFTNGTYTIALNVTDSTGRSVTSSKTLTVLSNTGGSTVPVLVGWGGIRLDEAAVGGGVNQPTNPTPSAVFPGEPATNMELALMEMSAMGYNTVRVDFDPYCTASQYMSAYSSANLQRAIQIAQHYSFWIIIDYHGYSEPFNSSQTTCWLNFWSGVTSQFKNSYSQIIWEPLNEPCYNSSSCAGSSTTNDMCSGASSCVATLSHEYQLWINQTRAQGDTHWIVVQNICSYGCSLSNWADGYPTVTDPLGTLSQGGRIFISLHSYMGYSSSSWNNATADSMAQQYYNAVASGVSTTGWPALNTEGGADPLCTSCAPDQVLTGSAGYTVVTFHFIQTLTNLYDTNTPQRINWIWWPAGSWTNTPGSGIYGALQCINPPVGWGCLLNFVPPGPPVPDFALSANPSSLAVNTGTQGTTTIGLNILNGFASTVTLTTSSPTGLSVSLSKASITGTATSTLTVSSANSGIFQVTVIGTGGSLTRRTTITVTVGNQAAPVLNAPTTATIQELTTLSFAVSATDSSTPSPTLTITASQLPSGATFVPTQGTSPTATFTWTPDEAQSPGTFSITLTVAGGVVPVQKTIVVTVVEPSTPPSISLPSSQETATVGKSLGFTVTAKDQSIAGDPVNLSASGLVKNMAFDSATGVFTFTPDQSQTGQTFNVNFTATYSDNPTASSSRTVTIKTEASTSQPSTGGSIPSGLTTTLWLVTIGALIGVVSSIALLHVRASAQLAAARRRSRSLRDQASTHRAPDKRSIAGSSAKRAINRKRNAEEQS